VAAPQVVGGEKVRYAKGVQLKLQSGGEIRRQLRRGLLDVDNREARRPVSARGDGIALGLDLPESERRGK
jgi:hypothetical protein